jgi:hypothetical protein
MKKTHSTKRKGQDDAELNWQNRIKEVTRNERIVDARKKMKQKQNPFQTKTSK